MNIYLAGLCSSSLFPGMSEYSKLEDNEKTIVDSVPHRLEYYHYINKERYVNCIREANKRVFLDSGAFSAHTLGVSIDLLEYCDYIKKNADIIRMEDGDLMASVLDGVGDPLKTYQNQIAMEENGVRPLPCFHYGEDERYLEYYIANYSYITIGGMVGKSSKDLNNWLDRIWSRYMLDGSGTPKTKVHAFGVTSVSLMEQYPWHSCDSSTWVQARSFGDIFDHEFGRIPISEKSPNRQTYGRHYSSFSPIENDMLKDRFTSNGFDPDRLMTTALARGVYNIWAFMQVNERLNRERFRKVYKQELF